MKTKIFKYLSTTLIVLTFVSINLKANSISDEKTVEITLPSIQCGMCVKTIKKALGKVEGVIESKVDLKNKKVTVLFDDSITSLDKIEVAITSAGYDANDKPANADAYENLSSCCKKP